MLDGRLLRCIYTFYLQQIDARGKTFFLVYVNVCVQDFAACSSECLAAVTACCAGFVCLPLSLTNNRREVVTH